MPNHVRNIVKIYTDKPKELRDNIATLFDFDTGKICVNPRNPEWIIDFDKIIPEPRFRKDCPESCIRTADSSAQELEDRPWFDWYTWRLKYWDTKWNAYDGFTTMTNSTLTFVFSTAWSAPMKIYYMLAELGYDMEIEYADEDLGSNCGSLLYTATEEEWTRIPIENTEEFAEEVWDKAVK